MREIPRKNYVIITLMAVGVVVVCFILMNMYNSNNNEVYNSAVREVVSEIKYDDLESYLQENLDVVLYINDSNKKANQKLEREIRDLITDNNIQQYVVYIEKNNELVREYSLDSYTPIFIAYQDGKITEVLSDNNYSIEEIESFFVRNGVIESD